MIQRGIDVDDWEYVSQATYSYNMQQEAALELQQYINFLISLMRG